jgi:hypothetical protein
VDDGVPCPEQPVAGAHRRVLTRPVPRQTYVGAA